MAELSQFERMSMIERHTLFARLLNMLKAQREVCLRANDREFAELIGAVIDRLIAVKGYLCTEDDDMAKTVLREICQLIAASKARAATLH
jgi:hypothetical protein